MITSAVPRFVLVCCVLCRVTMEDRIYELEPRIYL
jgi:hypothetical protein